MPSSFLTSRLERCHELEARETVRAAVLGYRPACEADVDELQGPCDTGRLPIVIMEAGAAFDPLLPVEQVRF